MYTPAGERLGGATHGTAPRHADAEEEPDAETSARPRVVTVGSARRRSATMLVTGQRGVSMSSAQLYDTIGTTYTATRRTEPRIAAQIWAALGDARTVVNVGAGTGSYEPSDRQVLAVEPSSVMRSQRPPSAAPCLAATAEKLPFEDACFDAAMAIATVHHWQDPIAGLREMRRVARRVVVFTYDVSDLSRFWLTRDYVPEVLDLLAGRPSLSDQADAIGACIEPVLIPWDCVDGSLRPTGGARKHTWMRVSGAVCRPGPNSGPTSSRGPCEASGKTSPQVGGVNATAVLSVSPRQTLALDCSSHNAAFARYDLGARTDWLP